MSDKFEITTATRRGVTPLIGLYSESGCGKTYSSLMLARGLAGEKGRIVLIDTETRRGSLYADVIPGGYDVLDLDAPFTPERYRAALDAALQADPACVIMDSMSHEWEGVGGVLDMATEIEIRTKKPGLHCWKTPKMEHTKLVLQLLRCPVPLVCCIRAKHKSRQMKDAQNKTIIVKDEHTSPIQAEDFIFEMTAHAEILPNHTIRLTKCSHPALRECLPDGDAITITHGEKLAAWCKGSTDTIDRDGWIAVCKADSKLAEMVKELKWKTGQCRKVWKAAEGDAVAFDREVHNAHAYENRPDPEDGLPLEERRDV